MSAPETVQRYGTIVVVGGGCYGGYYVRQLERAARAGALIAERVVVVDRDPDCAVSVALANPVEKRVLAVGVRVADWREFFAGYLSGAAREPDRFARDAIVPSPLMPHLMAEWLVAQARSQFADRLVSTQPFENPPDVPWSRAGEDGTHYVSFATWMCPVNCIEPRICPHTRDTRTWSLPERISDHAGREGEEGRPVVVATLHCRHRAYGVGMFDTAEVIAAKERIFVAAERDATDVVIGTMSHCHGALTRLVIGAPLEQANSPIP
jgi:hypothetical protein